MIHCKVRFRDAFGSSLIEDVQYPLSIPAILPIGSSLFIPSYNEDSFLFKIVYYRYSVEKYTSELIVFVSDDQHEGYEFNDNDIRALVENGWEYLVKEDSQIDAEFFDSLTVRVQYALRDAGIKTVSQLTEMTEPRVLLIPQIRLKGLEEIKDQLAILGMKLKN